MFQGQYLFKDNIFYSPWMKRQGDNIRVTAEALAIGGHARIYVRVYHKNTDEVGPGAEASGTNQEIQLLAVGRDTDEWMGVKELVRYRFQGIGSVATDYTVFRMLNVVWFNDVKA